MNRIAERSINFVASLITIGLFLLSALPATKDFTALAVTPLLGVETRIAGLLLVELAILYSARILFRRVLELGPFVEDQVAASFALIGVAVVIGWASAIDLNFFFPQDVSSDSFGRIIYIGFCVLIGASTNSEFIQD